MFHPVVSLARTPLVLLALLALAGASGSAHAQASDKKAAASQGFYIEHEAVVPNPMTQQIMTHKVRTWHQGKQLKRDNPMRNETVIVDLAKGEVYGVNDEQKTYWVVPVEKYRQLAMLQLVVMGVRPRPDGGVDVPPNLFTPSGKVETIAGKKAYEVKVNADGMAQGGFKMETSYWLSADVKIPIERMIDELRITLNDPQAPEYKKLYDQWRKLDGYPVRTVTSITTPQGDFTTTETLVDFKRMKIDPKEFTVPKGYAKTVDPITQLEGMQRQMQERMRQERAGGGGGAGGMPGGALGLPPSDAPPGGAKKRVLPRQTP